MQRVMPREGTAARSQLLDMLMHPPLRPNSIIALLCPGATCAHHSSIQSWCLRGTYTWSGEGGGKVKADQGNLNIRPYSKEWIRIVSSYMFTLAPN